MYLNSFNPHNNLVSKYYHYLLLTDRNTEAQGLCHLLKVIQVLRGGDGVQTQIAPRNTCSTLSHSAASFSTHWPTHGHLYFSCILGLGLGRPISVVVRALCSSDEVSLFLPTLPSSIERVSEVIITSQVSAPLLNSSNLRESY